MMMLNEREKLLKRVQMANFALADVSLYLDTHPMDQEALNYYNKYRKLNEQAMMEYTQKFGPLSPDNIDVTNKWTWIENPWPWENEV